MEWKEFEKLVHWIQTCLNKNAIVKHNDKLIDRQTNKQRQIDISIRIKEGTFEILGIIEAKHWKRPVGIEFVDQFNSTIKAAGANFGCIVSNSGFTETAILKAKDYGIFIYTLKEALKTNWSDSIKIFRNFIHQYICGDSTIWILNKETKQIIDLHPDLLRLINEKGKNVPIFWDEKHLSSKSLADLGEHGFSEAKLIDYLLLGKENAQSFNIFVDLSFHTDKYYFIDINGSIQPLILYVINGIFWKEREFILPEVLQYKNDNNKTDVIAELMTFGLSTNHEIEILTEHPDDINTDRPFHIRCTDLKNPEMKININPHIILLD